RCLVSSFAQPRAHFGIGFVVLPLRINADSAFQFLGDLHRMPSRLAQSKENQSDSNGCTSLYFCLSYPVDRDTFSHSTTARCSGCTPFSTGSPLYTARHASTRSCFLPIFIA